MENKNWFELNDDALDAVSGGTASTSSKWSEGMQIEMDLCPCCRTYQVTGIVQDLIYKKRGSTTPDSVSVRFNCCGQSTVLDTESL